MTNVWNLICQDFQDELRELGIKPGGNPDFHMAAQAIAPKIKNYYRDYYNPDVLEKLNLRELELDLKYRHMLIEKYGWW